MTEQQHDGKDWNHGVLEILALSCSFPFTQCVWPVRAIPQKQLKTQTPGPLQTSPLSWSALRPTELVCSESRLLYFFFFYFLAGGNCKTRAALLRAEPGTQEALDPCLLRLTPPAVLPLPSLVKGTAPESLLRNHERAPALAWGFRGFVSTSELFISVLSQ